MLIQTQIDRKNSGTEMKTEKKTAENRKTKTQLDSGDSMAPCVCCFTCTSIRACESGRLVNGRGAAFR